MKIGMEYCEKCYPNAMKAFFITLVWGICCFVFGIIVGSLI